VAEKGVAGGAAPFPQGHRGQSQRDGYGREEPYRRRYLRPIRLPAGACC